MTQHDDHPTNVQLAFEILLEEVEQEAQLVNNLGSHAFLAGDYERVEEARVHGIKLIELRAAVAELQSRWQELSLRFRVLPDEVEAIKAPKRNLGRIEHGARTQEDVFWLPILQALVVMGGSGRVREVLDRVETSLRGVLNEVDYQPIKSEPGTTRWHNTARWARNQLTREGLLRDDSPRGVWEITDAGRRYLKEHPQRSSA